MNSEQLSELLRQHEGPTLEFKQRWYQIDSLDAGTRTRNRDELIKDILSLANGSPLTAGDEARLVIGASDAINDDGHRQLYDAIDFSPDGAARQISQMVSSACTPAIGHLEFELVPIDGFRLGVLTVHPTPHLHETTRSLRASSGDYREHTVFVRAGDEIRIATGEERDAIRLHKRHRAGDYARVSPVGFGSLVGLITGASSAATFARSAGSTTGQRLAAVIVAAAVFAAFGAVLGVGARQVLEVRRDWYRVKPHFRWLFAALVAVVVTWFVAVYFQQLLKP